MRTHYLRLLFPVLAAALVAGCGGGGGASSTTQVPLGDIGKTGTGSGNGLTATASLSGILLSLTATTDRSDTAQVWATATGVSGQVMLTGSGRDWSGSATVTADANAVITVDVYARDSAGNTWGPARVLVRMGEFGAQSAVIGQVVSAESSSPIAGATISLGGQTATTDGTGKFVVTGLVSGTTLTGLVSKSGFVERTFTVTVGPETVDVGKLTLASTPDLPPEAPTFN